MSRQDIHLALGVEINPQYLGARLESYINTKVSITTFKLCIQYAQDRDVPLRKLSNDVIQYLLETISIMAATEEIVRWKQQGECLEIEKCRKRKRIMDSKRDAVEAEYDGKAEVMMDKYGGLERKDAHYRLYNWVLNEHPAVLKEHHKLVDACTEEADPEKRQLTFYARKRIFAEQTGVEISHNAQIPKSRHDKNDTKPTAYLSIPVQTFQMPLDIDEGVLSFAGVMDIDKLKNCAETQENLLSRAAKLLGLPGVHAAGGNNKAPCLMVLGSAGPEEDYSKGFEYDNDYGMGSDYDYDDFVE